MASIAKPVGSQIVILDGGINELAKTTDFLNRKVFYRLSGEGRDHADAHAVQFEATAGALALLPLSPVHIKARRKADGVHVSWIRRTRYGGDSWEIAEVPLNEESEAYQMDVFAGSSIKRSLTVSAPAAVYTNAQEIADFGVQQAHLTLRIRQISALAGAGFAREGSIPIV